MSTELNTEPSLPTTPTNEGRQPEINNFGYNLPFDKLTAVWVGLAGSLLMAFGWLWGALAFPWYVNAILMVAPAIGGHLYTKLWIEDALPHTQRDMVARLMTVELDFERPFIPWVPFIPSLRSQLTMCEEPERGAGGGHPLLRMRARKKE